MTENDAISPPTSAILRICNALDEAITSYLRVKDLLVTGTYEADIEAILIFNLSIRHVEAVITLARRDLVLLPAAFSVARAAFECGVRAAWLVNEADPLMREARWLAHIEGEISALTRSANRIKATGANVADGVERARVMQEFRDAIATALQERGIELLKQTPNFAAMLKSIGGDHLYTTYIKASQYAHGGHQATWLYRSGGLGVNKTINERISAEDWLMPLRMCWLALGYPGEVIVSRISGAHVGRWSDSCATLVETSFRDLADGRPDLLN